MNRVFVRQILFAAISLIAVVLLSSCGTVAPVRQTHQLPPFEPPIAKADFQTVRTTAYTHTESDHLEYGKHNALGGELRAATVPSRRRAEYIDRTLPRVVDAGVEYQFAAASKKNSAADDEEKPKAKKAKAAKHDDDAPTSKSAKALKPAKSHESDDDDADAPKSKSAKVVKKAKAGDADEKPSKSKEKRVAKNEKEKARDEKKLKNAKKAVAVKKPSKPVIGSAAADWARWPYGTTFRVLSTGQVYRVDDIGWALAGRNTIDLYMPNSHEMNQWGTRNEKIQIIKWGDEEESARLLAARSDYKHVRRMLLELSGRYDEAAQLQ